MATSTIRLPDGSAVQGNWATEETLDNLLTVMQNAYGNKGTGGGKQSRAQDENTQKLKMQSRKLQELMSWYDRQKGAIKDRINGERDLLRTNRATAESLDLLGDTSRLAGHGVKKLSGAASDTVDEFNKLDGSVQGASDSFFKVVGSAGAIGTAFGVAAGVIDRFAEFQIAAMQTGFSFSQELLSTRENVAGLGLNMNQLSEIIVSNGEAIRMLGGTGAESANAFIDLVKTVKESSRQFGLFGMTTDEIAGLTAERLDLLRKQGFGSEVAARTASESFSLLNQEVLAYAKLTGRERREIMRNRLATQADSALLLEDLAKLGPNASSSFDMIMDNMSAIFGDASGGFVDIFKGSLETYFMGGMERLSQDQLRAMEQVPGMKELFEKARNEFIENAANPQAMRDISLSFSKSVATLLDENSEHIVKMARIQDDDGVGALLTEFIAAQQAARNFLARSTEEIDKAFNEPMSRSERELMMLRDRIQVLQNQFQATLLNIVGFDDLEKLMSDENFENAQKRIAEFGDALGKIREGIVNLANAFDSENGSIVDELVIGAGLLFAANSAFTLAMVAGAGAMWRLVNGKIGGAAAGAEVVGGGKNAKGWKRIFAPLAALVAGASAYDAYGDEELKNSGMSGIERIRHGLSEDMLQTLDWMANTTNSLLGIDMGGSDLAGSYRQHVMNNASRYQERKQQAVVPKFDPSVSTDFHYVPQNLTGTVGVSSNSDGSMSTNITPDNAWRHGARGEALLEKLIQETQEQNRLLRRQNEAIDSQ